MDEFEKNEPPFSAELLLAEIEPLLKEYFKGKIKFTGNAISYVLPNGQNFLITAREVI